MSRNPDHRARSSKSAPPDVLGGYRRGPKRAVSPPTQIPWPMTPPHVCHSDIPTATRCDTCFAELPKKTDTNRKRVLQTSSAERKMMPLFSGLLAYFPDALAEVARISYLGNQKHNPGEELHWARGKSMDHADCVARHLIEHGTLDPEGNSHSAQLCWRALALYQQELEDALGLPLPRGAKPAK